MLGSEVLSVRLGGIYALQRLAEEHPQQYHVQIMQLFCAFVRNPTGEAEHTILGHYENGDPVPGLREDAQAVMNAIDRRTGSSISLEEASENFHVGLQGAKLQHAHLPGMNLSGISFGGANLSGAVLEGADLSDAWFISADLSSASLLNADLSDADLSGANLSDAILIYADLSGADLSGADLAGAILLDAILTGASFSRIAVVGDHRISAMGLTKAQLNMARSDPDNHPDLDGVLDAETGEQLVWRGKTLEEEGEES